MNDQRFSALIVDDEPSLRRLTAIALSHVNFSCDQAADGEEASDLVGCRKYDVVVTDLRMPNRNGHALAVELLAHGEQRPLVVVLTGVLEPRLATDLIARGVDAVEFKPVNFSLFGAKIRALCERRTLQRLPVESQRNKPDSAEASGRVTLEHLNERLEALSDSLPVCQAAIDVVNLIDQQEASADAIMRCIARDPGLSVEILKVANSSYYNPTGQQCDDLHTAVHRLGQRIIRELALASTALQVLSKSVMSWVDADLVWRRCLATAQAMEHLHPAAMLGEESENLFLTALLMPMSRVFVGLVFPELYQGMVSRCLQTGGLLSNLEREILPQPPEAILASYLARVKLSQRIHRPLKRAGTPYSELAKLTEPLQTIVGHLRMAVVLGQLTVGRWMPWEEIELPPSDMIRRLKIKDLASLVDCIRGDLSHLAAYAPQENRHDLALGSGSETIAYFNLTSQACDLFGAMTESLGLKLIPVTNLADCGDELVIVNGLDVSDDGLARFLKDHEGDHQRLVVRSHQRDLVKDARGNYLTIPCRFDCFRDYLSAAVANQA